MYKLGKSALGKTTWPGMAGQGTTLGVAGLAEIHTSFWAPLAGTMGTTPMWSCSRTSQPSHHSPPSGCPPRRCLVSNAALSCSVTDGGNCFNIPLLINSVFDKHRQYLSVFLEVLSWPPGAQMFYLCPPCSVPTPQGWLQLLAVQARCGSPCRTASPALLVNCESATLKLSVKL